MYVYIYMYSYTVYNVKEEIKDARDLWNMIQDLARSSNFYCWLFILFQSSLFDEFDLRNLQTSFHPIEHCQIGGSSWTHSQALALQQSWVFVFRLVFSKWIGIIFMQRSSKSSSPIKVCVEPPKKTQSMAGEGVGKSHRILLRKSPWLEALKAWRMRFCWWHPRSY